VVYGEVTFDQPLHYPLGVIYSDTRIYECGVVCSAGGEDEILESKRIHHTQSTKRKTQREKSEKVVKVSTLTMLQSTAFLGEISTKYRSLISSRWISRDPHPKLGWASVFAHTHTDD
jgi:hypothetical protein